ncbi:hypothetical protein JCM11251_002002 [Rhodosporidiobolus azoricus]
MQGSHRISISDVASTLFPRTANPPSLRSQYTLQNPTGPRSAATRASAAYTHDSWFAFGEEKQRKRGIETQKRILDVLRDAGQLLEPDNLDDLAKPLRNAQTQARRTGKPVFISTGLIRPPDLRRDYTKRGWASPGIKWANFRPALLRIDHLGPSQGKKDHFRLQVVGIRSTHPDAVPGEVRITPSRSRLWRRRNPISPLNPQVYKHEEFQILAHRFFLIRLLAHLQRKKGNDLLKRLSISNTSALWRYTGCYSHSCTDSDCFLNLDTLFPAWLLARLHIIPVKDDPALVEDVLFNQVPNALRARRVGQAGVEEIQTGFAQVVLEDRVPTIHGPAHPEDGEIAHIYSAWVL